jgi:hypothetical protein
VKEIDKQISARLFGAYFRLNLTAVHEKDETSVEETLKVVDNKPQPVPTKSSTTEQSSFQASKQPLVISWMVRVMMRFKKGRRRLPTKKYLIPLSPRPCPKLSNSVF